MNDKATELAIAVSHYEKAELLHEEVKEAYAKLDVSWKLLGETAEKMRAMEEDRLAQYEEIQASLKIMRKNRRKVLFRYFLSGFVAGAITFLVGNLLVM